MQITFRRRGILRSLLLAGNILADFHRYELLGFGYALLEVGKKSAVCLDICADGRRSGYLIHTLPDSCGRIRIQYLATDAALRGKGIGSAALHKLRQFYPHCVLFFEVENPAYAADAKEQQIMQRRIGFYSRCGFTALPFEIHAGPWELLCMTNYPEQKEQIRRYYAEAWSEDVLRGE